VTQVEVSVHNNLTLMAIKNIIHAFMKCGNKIGTKFITRTKFNFTWKFREL